MNKAMILLLCITVAILQVKGQEYENSCPENSTLVSCKSECPDQECPKDDSLEVVFCDPAPECSFGCQCTIGYRRVSSDDPTCILAEDCPPIPCTGENEEFNQCPNECLSGYCDDVGKEDWPCDTFVHNCQPQCTCTKGHYRNYENNTCIPAEDCPLPEVGE